MFGYSAIVIARKMLLAMMGTKANEVHIKQMAH